MRKTLIFLLALAVCTPAFATTKTVSKSGTADFTSIQAAIDSFTEAELSDGTPDEVVILDGESYDEQVVIGSLIPDPDGLEPGYLDAVIEAVKNRDPFTLKGNDPANRPKIDPVSGGGIAHGVFTSDSGDNFIATLSYMGKDITVENIEILQSSLINESQYGLNGQAGNMAFNNVLFAHNGTETPGEAIINFNNATDIIAVGFNNTYTFTDCVFDAAINGERNSSIDTIYFHGNGQGDADEAGISIDDVGVTALFDGCQFLNSDTAMIIRGNAQANDITVRNCYIANNNHGLRASGKGTFYVENCIFHNNMQIGGDVNNDLGALETVGRSGFTPSLVVKNSLFAGNMPSDFPTMAGSLGFESRAAAIRIKNDGTDPDISIEGCSFVDNTVAIRFADTSGRPRTATINDCIFKNNNSSVLTAHDTADDYFLSVADGTPVETLVVTGINNIFDGNGMIVEDNALLPNVSLQGEEATVAFDNASIDPADPFAGPPYMVASGAPAGVGADLSKQAGGGGLIGHWEFEEGSGDIAVDSSGNGNDGTISHTADGGVDDGSVWYNDPIRGAVASFGGLADDGYILTAQNIPVMTAEQNFTWAFWANDLSIDAANNIIFGNRMSTTPADFSPRQFIKFTPTKFEWHMNGNGNDNLEYDASEDTASNDIPDGKWIHHAVVKEGPVVTYYRNGLAMNSREITQPLAEPQPLFMGGDNEGSDGENWRGLLDDVRIYSIALTSDEVADLAGRLGIFDSHKDIDDGRLGAAGGAYYDPVTDTYTIDGSGWDVWESGDDFHYVYKEWSGDFSLEADVGVDGGNPDQAWIKSMIMARQNLTPGSVNYTTRIRRDGQFSSQWRPVADANGASTPSGERVVIPNPSRQKLVRSGNMFSSYYQETDGSWVQVGQTIEIVLTDPILIGFGVCAHDIGQIATGTFSNVLLKEPIGIFDDHRDIDDGRLGAAGGASYDPATDTYTIDGSGYDVWETADDFHFAYKELCGDFSLEADIGVDGNPGQDWIKSMIMARQDLSPSSANYTTRIRRDGQFSSQWRTAAGGSSASTPSAERVVIPNPSRQKLVRSGNTFSSYYQAADGSWIQIGASMEIPMVDPILVGFGVCAHDIGQIATGTFSNVVLTVSIPLSDSWVVGADSGVWKIQNGILSAFANNGNDPKHAWVNMEMADGNYTVKCDVRMVTWEDGDLPRAGIAVRINPDDNGANPGSNRGLNLLFHDDTNSVDILNDLVSWGPRTDVAWEVGTWYTLALEAVDNTLNAYFCPQGGDVLTSPLATWTDSRNSNRSPGFPGLTASTYEGLEVQFDNFEVLVNGLVVFADDFGETTAVTDWALY